MAYLAIIFFALHLDEIGLNLTKNWLKQKNRSPTLSLNNLETKQVWRTVVLP